MNKIALFFLIILINFSSSFALADNINFYNEEYIVTKNGRQGICNKNGKCSYNIIYKQIIPIYSRYLIFQVSDNNYFLIDTKKDTRPAIRRAEYISPSWDLYLNFYYIPIKNEGKTGIIKYNYKTYESEQSLPCLYDEIIQLQHTNGLYYVMKKGGKQGIVNIDNGKEITPFIYDEITNISHTGYLKLKFKDKYALFDSKTEMYTEPIFQDVRVGKLKIGDYGENLEIKYDGKWHYLKKGKIAGQIAGQTGKNIFMTIVAVAGAPIVIPIAVWWHYYAEK